MTRMSAFADLRALENALSAVGVSVDDIPSPAEILARPLAAVVEKRLTLADGGYAIKRGSRHYLLISLALAWSPCIS